MRSAWLIVVSSSMSKSPSLTLCPSRTWIARTTPGRCIPIRKDTTILDYGCGVGRIAKELTARHGCSIVGVDISESMRALSVSYVASDRFLARSPAELKSMVDEGIRFDAALCIWVLQHCVDPWDDLALLRAALKPDGNLFVLNNNVTRAIPTADTWIHDGIDVKRLLSESFAATNEGVAPNNVLTWTHAGNHFWSCYRNTAPATPSA